MITVNTSADNAKRRRVLLIHGAGGGGWEWVIWERVFRAAGWRVDAPDLLPSSQGIAATTLHDYLAQVIAALDQNGTASAETVLVGASMGGLLARLAAGERPVAALILVNPSSSAAGGRTTHADEGRQRGPDSRLKRPVRRWRSQPLIDTLSALPDGSFASALWARQRWRDESGLVLDQVRQGVPVPPSTCPVLILGGERDRSLPVAMQEQLARSLGCDHLIVPGASHLGPLLGDSASLAAAMAMDWLSARRLGPMFSFNSDRPA